LGIFLTQNFRASEYINCQISRKEGPTTAGNESSEKKGEKYEGSFPLKFRNGEKNTRTHNYEGGYSRKIMVQKGRKTRRGLG